MYTGATGSHQRACTVHCLLIPQIFLKCHWRVVCSGTIAHFFLWILLDQWNLQETYNVETLWHEDILSWRHFLLRHSEAHDFTCVLYKIIKAKDKISYKRIQQSNVCLSVSCHHTMKGKKRLCTYACSRTDRKWRLLDTSACIYQQNRCEAKKKVGVSILFISMLLSLSDVAADKQNTEHSLPHLKAVPFLKIWNKLCL